MLYSVIQHQPTSLRLDGWRRQADLVCVPPRALARLHHHSVATPMTQIGRVRNPDVSSQGCHRSMDKCPQSANSVRQKSSVLVVRRHDDSVSLKRPKIHGEREGHSGTAFGVRGVGHGKLLQLWNVSDTRIFDTPKLFRIFIWIGHQSWCWIDPPSVNAVHRTRGTEMREAAAILHPAEQQRGAIRKQCCSGVKYAIDPIRPIFAGQNWIGGMPVKESVGRVDSVDGQSHRWFHSNSKLTSECKSS